MELQKTIKTILAIIKYYDSAMSKIENQRGLYPDDPDEFVIYTF